MNDIDKNIKDFIHDNIRSMDELRILLLLYRNQDKELDVLTISSMLYSKPDVVKGALKNLQENGLAVNSPGQKRSFIYKAKNKQTDDLVSKVIELDQTQPVSLINLVYSRPKDIQAFADAFKFRNDKEK